MLVSFAVDPEALSLKGHEFAPRDATHERLVERWCRVGELVYFQDRFEDLLRTEGG